MGSCPMKGWELSFCNVHCMHGFVENCPTAPVQGRAHSWLVSRRHALQVPQRVWMGPHYEPGVV